MNFAGARATLRLANALQPEELPMIPLLILPLFLLQDPTPAPAALPAPDPRILFNEWAGRLERAKVVHIVADGVLVNTDSAKPELSVRWSFSTEIWMAKGGRVNAKTRWTGPKPEQGQPESFTQIALANGVHTWQGSEGTERLKQSELATARFVPYPLPEIFALFDGQADKDLPAAKVGGSFDWGEPVHTMPTVIVMDPQRPKTEPAFWYGFGERELAGWCTMNPERLGGDVLRGKLKKLEWLEKLPEQDPPRFEPKTN